MTETREQDPNADRERLADEAIGRDAADQPESGPWAKTSSGDADSVTDDED